MKELRHTFSPLFGALSRPVFGAVFAFLGIVTRDRRDATTDAVRTTHELCYPHADSTLGFNSTI